MIRFDEERRTVTLSVRDLADENDYRFCGPAPLSLKRRAVLGRLAHEDHQEAREDELSSYRRERSVRYETRVDGWRVVVQGRIDGIYTDAEGRTVIEEVKTVVARPEELEAADEGTFPAYARQLQLYRFLLEEGSGALGFDDRAPPIALHLCLISLPDRAVRVLELGYRRERCRALVDRRLREILAARRALCARAAERRAACETVRFPHPRPRPQQQEMMDAIERALAAGRGVLVSAPPGIGKSAAALVPALRYAASVGGRVFVATSKTTQQAIFAKTVAMLRRAGAKVRGVVLTAKGKVCLNDVVHCHPEHCAHAADYERKLMQSGALERLRRLPLAGREDIEREARAHDFCPFEASLDLAGDADVIIGDYNYVFDPGANARRIFVDGDPQDVVLLIDEAHNLYERGARYYSPALRRDALIDIERRLAGRTAPLARRARALAQRLAQRIEAYGRGRSVLPAAVQATSSQAENLLLFDDPPARQRERRQASGRLRRRTPLAPQTPPPPPPAAPGEGEAPCEREVELDREWFFGLRDELAELSVAWFAEGNAQAQGEEGDPVLELNRWVSRFAGVLELEGEEFAQVWTREGGGALKILCKDPSRQLGRRLSACAGAVAVSATLEPLSFYRDVLGFGRDAALHSFPSPFDRSRRRVLVLDRPSTAYRERERDLPIVDDAVRAVVSAYRGNYLVCCPSFDYLEKLARQLGELPGYETLRQTPSMGEGRRAEVLERLRRAASEAANPVLLLAVQGGIFTEGVDYPGAECVGAIIIGPGLPRVGFERELIQEHFQKVYGRGFEYAFLYPGMNKVIQAAGRVIRTPTDKGVVVLVGSRFATPRYAELFPRDWYERSPRELVCTDPYGELRRFWGERDEARVG
ncbi:MAG: hypothetical protein D6731_07740 [Planctomycetota bacterium]|nr:MAG: hypothetical protein D6731_07740 [Planctomycetota bacterium]